MECIKQLIEVNGNVSLNIKKLLNGSILMIYFQRKKVSLNIRRVLYV